VIATLRHRDFALLWTAGLISVAGDFALIIVLPLHAYALTGSAVATGAVFAASFLPRVLLGSIAGVFVDRWDRKRTMVAADLLRAALLLPLLAVGSPDLLWLLYLVRAATGTVGLLFERQSRPFFLAWSGRNGWSRPMRSTHSTTTSVVWSDRQQAGCSMP
jgi:MFS family permease